MLKKTFTLVAGMVLMAQMSYAVLPPLAQQLAELRAIFASTEMDRLGMAEMIENIEKTETGYLIKSTNKKMEVDIIHLPSGIGPVKFDLNFKEPTPRFKVPEVKLKTK